MSDAAVAVHGLTKHFGGQLALDHVDVDVAPGSVHAVAGENGAGKSTLIKILAGVHQPDEGTILAEGEEVTLRTPRDPRSYGFAFLHQQLNLVPNMTVRENLLLTSTYPMSGRFLINWGAVERAASRSLDTVGLSVRPDALVRELSPAEQQLVAFARVLLHKPRLIVLDEPTASLGASDTRHLLELIVRQREAGATVIFVSHRIDEILEICDTVTVLRDGRLVATVPRSSLTRESLVHMLGGAAEHHEHLGATLRRKDTPRLELVEMRTPGIDHPVSLSVHSGEVVGLAGLVGSGRTTLLNTIAGGHAVTGGSVKLEGTAVDLKDRLDARRRGLVLVPESRGLGIIPDFGIPENISLGHVERYAWKRLVLDKGRERRAAERLISDLEIKRAKGDSRIRFLSGGNQQKVLLARALDVTPSVLLLDEPTAGIDIATKEYLYGLVRELAASGISILFVSSELDELPLVCDRILIFKRGAVTAELPGGTTRATIVGHLFARDAEARQMEADGSSATADSDGAGA